VTERPSAGSRGLPLHTRRRIFSLRVVAGGAELWRITVVPGERDSAILEEHFKSADVAGQYFEEIERGAPGKVLAQLMGHTNADLTLSVYTQVVGGALRTAADRSGSELFTIVHKTETGSELNP
jgi:hypothetical protein